MARLTLRRLALSVPLLFIVSAFTFVLVSLIPGNAAEFLLGPDATSAEYAAVVKQLHLGQPVWVQYWHWLVAAVHGNLGSSLASGQSVASFLSPRLTISLTLMIGGTIFAAVTGVLLGVFAAVRSGWVARVIEAISAAGIAVPHFWLGLELIELFAVKWRLLPAIGFVSFSQSPADWARSLVLPVLTIGIGGMTVITAQTRDAMLHVLGRDFVRVLQANGISRRSVIFRHALKNAALPIVTVIGLLFVGLLAATVIAENVYSIPGLGSALVNAVSEHDLPVIEGVVLYFTLIVIGANLIIDIVYGILDPKV